MSCSHGAGRVMGRQQACRSLSKDDCDKAMQGIVFDGWKHARGKFGRGKPKTDLFDLEEAPPAYKNIEDVIAAQQDLVRTLVKLRPLGVIKG
jgi:tRNA-splicing ligase RtcB